MHIFFNIALFLVFLSGVSAQNTRDLRLEKDAPPAAGRLASETDASALSRYYALVVGISKYRNLAESQQLNYPDRDAEEIYSVLISKEGGNFRAQNVHKLIGPEATLANLRKELEVWLPSTVAEGDTVLIYFAGHGFVSQGRPFLAPYDLDPNNIPGTGYSMDRLGAVVGSQIKAKNKILLTDACHSGAITPGTDSQTFTNSLLSLNRSVFSLTASRDREQSFESPDWGGGHGIFTYYVINGLKGEADENRDARITADELAEYVHRNVRDATSGRQNPTSDRGSFDPDLQLAFVPKNRMVSGSGLAKLDMGSLAFESNLDGVEVFVDGESRGTVDRGKALKLPGLRPGIHTVKGVKMGYEPDGPREEMVYPGQETVVSFKILIVRRRPRAAVDSFEKGMEYYNKGFASNYKKAAEQFEKALSMDPTYSQAALFLGRSWQGLFEMEKAVLFFRKAVEIDPDYLEARAGLGGLLLDTGSVDESIRQFHAVLQRNPEHSTALYLLAQAFRMKDSYAESIAAARKAIQLTPRNAEAHFWLAESLRMSNSLEEARQEYLSYLKLSDFESKLGGKINYYVLGFLVGMGKKKRAAQEDIWKDLRSLAYFGLGDCYRLLRQPDLSIDYYRKSLALDDQDPQAHYGLGLALCLKAEISQSTDTLSEARSHFETMLKINSDLAQADKARKYMASIDSLLKTRRP